MPDHDHRYPDSPDATSDDVRGGAIPAPQPCRATDDSPTRAADDEIWEDQDVDDDAHLADDGDDVDYDAEEPADGPPDIAGDAPNARAAVKEWHIRAVGHRPID